MFEDRVGRGAALLDRERPGWAREIAADRLRMETCTACILGQLYGNYLGGFLTLIAPLPSSQLFSASRYGFTLKDDEQQDDRSWDDLMADFRALADAWRAEIRRRTGDGDIGP